MHTLEMASLLIAETDAEGAVTQLWIQSAGDRCPHPIEAGATIALESCEICGADRGAVEAWLDQAPAWLV